jgi:hypothetical protein
MKSEYSLTIQRKTRTESTVRKCCGKRQKQHSRNRRTANLRFGATAAGSADLKGSAKMPPLRQAAARWLSASESVVEKELHLKILQFERKSPRNLQKK